MLESDGERYRLDRMEGEKDNLWEGYDPEAVHKAIEEYAGIWADRNADAMIERIYRAREEGSRPADRP